MKNNFPRSYFIGQEYARDRNLQIKVRYSFPTSTAIHHVVVSDGKVEMWEEKGLLVADLLIMVNETFICDINRPECHEILETMFECDAIPAINNELKRQKYDSANFFIKPISIYDAICAEIIDCKRMRIMTLLPSPSKASFPHDEEGLDSCRSLYVREYIDAISDKVYSDYESCIRRLITVMEIIFKDGTVKGGSFTEKMIRLTEPMAFSDEYKDGLRWNIWVAYKIRNAIVHDTYSCTYCDEIEDVCHKGIISLGSILQAYIGNEAGNRFISQIEIHYLFITRQRQPFHHLDFLTHYTENYTENKVDKIVTCNELTKFQSQGMRCDKGILATLGIGGNEDAYNGKLKEILETL